MKPKHDDWSCDPRKWSFDKLRLERKNGMPAVVAEWDRRMAEAEAAPNEKESAMKTKYDDWSCDPSKWSWDKLRRERKNGMPAVVEEWDRRMAEAEAAPNE
jgi:hypothetical protein